jgi:hypothetical protein
MAMSVAAMRAIADADNAVRRAGVEKAALMEHFGLPGGPEGVPALAALLTDKDRDTSQDLPRLMAFTSEVQQATGLVSRGPLVGGGGCCVGVEGAVGVGVVCRVGVSGGCVLGMGCQGAGCVCVEWLCVLGDCVGAGRALGVVWCSVGAGQGQHCGGLVRCTSLHLAGLTDTHVPGSPAQHPRPRHSHRWMPCCACACEWRVSHFTLCLPPPHTSV